MLKGATIKIDFSQNRVMIRKSSSNDMDNIPSTVMGERERKPIGIETVKLGVNLGIALLKITPSVP